MFAYEREIKVRVHGEIKLKFKTNCVWAVAVYNMENIASKIRWTIFRKLKWLINCIKYLNLNNHIFQYIYAGIYIYIYLYIYIKDLFLLSKYVHRNRATVASSSYQLCFVLIQIRTSNYIFSNRGQCNVSLCMVGLYYLH